jgi:hypothetical protein
MGFSDKEGRFVHTAKQIREEFAEGFIKQQAIMPEACSLTVTKRNGDRGFKKLPNLSIHRQRQSSPRLAAIQDCHIHLTRSAVP